MAEPQRGDMGRNVDIDEVRDMRNQLNAAMVDMRDQILRVVDTGFRGVHHRQDITNGRINGLEEEKGRHDERITALEAEREVFHQHRRADDPPPPAVPQAPSIVDAEEKPVRRWDVLVVCGSLAGAYGILRFLQWLGPLFQQAQAGKP